MIRFLLSLLFVLSLLASDRGMAAEPIDQAGWNTRKQSVRLPNGVTLAYVELGDPKGEPLLLLHGYTDTSRSWTQVAPWLLRHRLLIPDQRGHGGSDKPVCCYSASTFAEDARLFLDSLKVEKAGVAGHSLGSMVAMTLAAEHPERVTKVVLIGSTALVPVKRGDWLWTNAHALKAPLDPGSEFLREWHPANQPTPVDKAFAEAAMAEILAIPLHVWRAVMRELADVPAGRHAADIKAPVLILSGGKDPLFPPQHHAALVKAIPHAEARVFPDLGHNLSWERTAEIGPVLARFFSDKRQGREPVIASEAKQSSTASDAHWIASSLRSSQ